MNLPNGSASAWPAVTLLGRLTSAGRDVMLHAGATVKFAGGHRMLRQGDTTRHVLLLVRGVAKVLAADEDGFEGILGIRVGGDIVGEMSALDGQPRSANVVACSIVLARVIRPTELEVLMASHPEIRSEIVRTISERLRWANQRRIDFRAHDAPTRVARILLELGERYGTPVGSGSELSVGLSQSELASLAGVAVPTVEKALHALSREGLIIRRYRQISIRDHGLLRGWMSSSAH